jgi:hypothetical protein
MSQEAFPFFESSEAATKHAIQASGREIKEVARALWPDKTVDAARTALSNALNENRSERLTADQHIFIAQFTGRFEWLHYACHQLSHTRPVPVTPAEQAAALQAALFEKSGELRALLDQVDALKPRLRSVA